jgi:serine/threonine protein kinase
VNAEDVRNETRAVIKLCQPGSNSNIVSVLRHGRLVNSPYFFLDMELCDLNLETYIQRKWTEALRHNVPQFSNVDILESRLKLAQVWNLMKDIANGIAYVHQHQEIHRDLKPRNGKIFYSHESLTIL